MGSRKAAAKTESTMQFTVSKSSLLGELEVVVSIIEKKPPVSTLKYLLLEAGEDLQLTGTDLDHWLRSRVTVQVEKAGAVLVDAWKLLAVVKSLPAADIDFKLTQDRLVVTCGEAQFVLGTIESEHFPAFPYERPEQQIVFSANVVRKLVRSVIYAICREESRYALKGALLIGKNKTLSMVATDGHRLSIAAVELDVELPDIRVLIRGKTLDRLELLLKEADQLECGVGDNHVFFTIGNRGLTAVQLVGVFPDYEQVIPKDNEKILMLSVENLTMAVKRAALMADKRSHGIKLELSEGRLVVKSQTPDLGEAKDEIDVEYKGKQVTVGFNAQYLLDCLVTTESREIQVELKDGESPALFRANTNGIRHEYVVMPMRMM